MSKVWLLVLGCCLGLSQKARATHIVGGEMELQHQTGFTYTLILNLYFDAVNGNAGALDPDLTASIFDKGTNNRMMTVTLPLVNNTFVNYTNPACAQPSLSTRKLVYSRNITLDPTKFNNSVGYYAAVERCCRNNTIYNIVDPAGAGQAYYLEFPAVMRNGQPFVDSTPRIFPPLSDYACRNELFYYDFGGQDADGDSLIYDLVTPLNGHATSFDPKPATIQSAPYVPITWGPGRSTTNQIPGNPTLAVNRFSGRLTVRPSTLGLFVFGVRCSEYRRGQKIGESRRDFQMLVIACAINTTPQLQVSTTAGAPPYRPGRDTIRITPTGNRCLRLRFTDADPASQLTASIRPVNFTTPLPTFTTATSGTVRSPGAPDTLTTTLCFPACMDSKGKVLQLDVIVADNGCSLPRRDTVRVAFLVQPTPNGPPAITSTAGPTLPLRARVGDTVSFDLLGTDPDNDPVTLELAGTGFDPATLGAGISQSTVGNQQQGRFSWRVPCAAAAGPQPREFVFKAVTMRCGIREEISVRVPVAIDYANVPPTISSTAGPTLPLRARIGDVISFDLVGTDPDNDPVNLTVAGNGFNPADLGATLTQSTVGSQQRGRFSWRVECPAVEGSQPKEFVFAANTTPCTGPQAATLTVPIIIDYGNQAPALSTTLPTAAPGEVAVVRLGLDSTYVATLAGLDADRDVLTLTAEPQNFDLGAAGMRFDTQSRPAGEAAGTFSWKASCDAVRAAGSETGLTVTFRLVDATCRPAPQSQTVRFEVQRPPAPEFLPPNVITPNNDGKNDAFTLPALPPDFCDARYAGVRIFSRWGQLLYESGDRNFSWNGNQVAGLYYYLITYTDGRKFKGWLEVLP